ncbi:MAG: L,D-transpeptidase [Methylacidiphilales bacterium]|nr:L,D-transpeptidase [Candidatus Methylacidiphilales bacterium]MDW8348799.1 L,D-transpeptidase [Verrucomicrobiae bacterium]
MASNTIDCKAQDDLRLPPKFILVSVPEQRLTLWEDGRIVRRYRISTSKFGLSNRSGSYGTPLGWHTIAAKIGDGVPVGGVFKNRVWTGEVLPVNAPGRDPIVTRILWLSGEEWHNSNSYDRKIYIHGTPEESTLGINSSYGCVRMASRDVIDLYDRVHVGTPVLISLLSTLSPEVRLQVASYWRYAHSPSFAFQQREPAFSGMREAPPVP